MRNRANMAHYQPYYPNGGLALDDAEVLKSSQIEYSGEPFDGWDTYDGRERVYFEDIRGYIEPDKIYVRVTDVADALKCGKVCRRRLLGIRSDLAGSDTIHEMLKAKGVKTMADLYRFVMEPESIDGKWDAKMDRCWTMEEIRPAIHTYSPFVAVKPIKTPKKWTIKHVWKAILSGQIFGYEWYTVDGADEYRRHGLDPQNRAVDLIESFGVWGPVASRKAKDGTTILETQTYCTVHTFYFDPARRRPKD